MTKPDRYLTRMSLFVGAVALISIGLIEPLQTAFASNPALNGVILATFLIGIVFVFRQVTMLKPEIAWVENYRKSPGKPVADGAEPRLLAPMAAMLGGEGANVRLSTLSLRTLLDSIGARLEEGREIARYLTGLLIFLGLLGTFWGLLGTISSIGNTIRGLTVETSDLALMFDGLKQGLEAPMAGMATAFSSSLFGLAGSVALGFLDLQAGQAQSRFYNDLEEWLSSVSRLTPAGAGLGEEGGASSAYVGALLEQSADSLEKLQRVMTRAEENRGEVSAAIISLSEQLAGLADQMKLSQEIMGKLAEGQTLVQKSLVGMAEGGKAPEPVIDEATRTHLRNMDVHLKRLLEEGTRGRERQTEELREEIKLLARTLAKAMDAQTARRGNAKDNRDDGDGAGGGFSGQGI